ncbi:hypothetical protein [Segniliparus rugosus]|uniref:Uncharacterized protein n=1 Tax=Segniliparus rugosus (strain ATCC BAA-974 / DSM 45345 / CCUG 50838 / CIP 108380 / JCM 13579 / CDC 945) TaxID=679197 RepID=E5XVF6_SEGRC|nr:hypothetical protein [Segniliparus rugosus]EFV11670.1 hypothetical protein HMPREF9336_03478 [Segniliparus rugosus ATCC BAA-974]
MTYPQPPQNPPGNGWQQPYPGQPQPGWQQPYPGQQWSGWQPGGPKKSPKPWIIGAVVAVVVLLLAVGIGVAVLSGGKEKPTGQTSSSIRAFSSSSLSSSSSLGTSSSSPAAAGPRTVVFKAWLSEPVPASSGHFWIKVWQNSTELKRRGEQVTGSAFPYEKTVTLNESDRANPTLGIGLLFFGENGNRINPNDPRTWNCELIVDGVTIDKESGPLGNNMSAYDMGLSCEYRRKKK